MKSVMWPTQTLCRYERMSESLKWNNLLSNSMRLLRLCWPKKVVFRSAGPEKLHRVRWSSADFHHEWVWPCSKVSEKKQTGRHWFYWCQQMNVLCQTEQSRREWRLRGVFFSRCLFETCSLELPLLPGTKRTLVFVLKHSVCTACSRNTKISGPCSQLE